MRETERARERERESNQSQKRERAKDCCSASVSLCVFAAFGASVLAHLTLHPFVIVVVPPLYLRFSMYFYFTLVLHCAQWVQLLRMSLFKEKSSSLSLLLAKN